LINFDFLLARYLIMHAWAEKLLLFFAGVKTLKELHKHSDVQLIE